MSDSQDNIKMPAWDVTEAWEQLQAARVAGDVAAELVAMRRWSEAQTNASIALVAQIVRPLSEQIANARAADLNWRVEWRERHDTQSDTLYRELDGLQAGQVGIKTLVEESVNEIKKEVGDLGRTLAAVVGDVSDLKETVQDHTLTLATHSQSITEVRSDLDQLRIATRAKFTAIEAKIAALDVEQALIRKVLDAHPQPEALRNAKR